MEALVLLALLWLYRFGRYLGRDQVDEAFRHAHEVLRWERPLGFLRERNVQQLVIDHHAIVRLLNRYYAMVHFPATGVFLASEGAASITGQVLYVDGGYQIMGM